MSKNKLIAIKRIAKDISEISKNPIKGIGMTQYEDDFLKYIVNIRLLNGIYEGYCLQMLLTFSEYYPIKPPKIQIFPGQNFNQTFHHHIFDDKDGFKKFCFDLLDNDFMSTNEANTGWNPSYTISSLLIQVQNFLSDPDMPKEHLPNESQIKLLMNSMKNYERKFIDKDHNIIIHTWDSPYPPIYGFEPEEKNENKIIEENESEKDIIETDDNSFNSSKNEENENITNLNVIKVENIINLDKNRIKGKININEENKIEKRVEEIRENLSCFLLRVNIIDDKDIALGYPLKQLKVLGDKIECVPIPEILSYEGYISQISKQDEKLDDYFNVTFKAANNECYNYWLPIYINEEHFRRNRTLILNSFSVLKYGAKGQKEYDFKPDHIFEYLPNLLNKMICGMFNNKSYMSEAYIRCYFQYLLLFKKLIEGFKDDFNKYLNKIINNIKRNRYILNKFIVPDLGNLFMLLYFSDIDLDKKIWNVLFEEKMVRKMFWTFHFSENEQKCKEIFDKYNKNDKYEINKKILHILKNEKVYYYEYIEGINQNEYHPCKEECLFSLSSLNIPKSEQIKPLKGIFSNCVELGIFEKIVEIISREMLLIQKAKSLKDILSKVNKKNVKLDEKTKNNTILKMTEFPSIYKKCSQTCQQKIDKLFLDNIDLLKFCSHELIEKYNLKEEGYFENNQIDKLMRKIDKKHHLEIIKELYGISRGNLLLITTLAQKKLNEHGFIKELENNFGIFFQVEDFIKEINNKIKEIQSYKDLFNFMKADILDEDEDEYEKIIKCYEKAKEKKYIKTSFKEEIESLKSIRGKNFGKYNNRNNNGNFKKRRINNTYRNNNNRVRGNYNNENNNNNLRRRNNFNSHFVDLDEFLED